MTITDASAPWRRDWAPSLPPRNVPPPPPPDPGPRTRLLDPGTPGATAVAWAPPAVPARQYPASPTGQGWAPAGLPAPGIRVQASRAAAAVSWSRPAPPLARRPAGKHKLAPRTEPCLSDVNYDPPEYSMGTGLMAGMPDGSIAVYPLSVVEPGCTVGDEGPINEAFLVSPVVRLAAGRPFALGSHIVIPAGATLYLNRASVDRDMITIGEGAAIID
jgi:hypothetical protein